MKNLVFFSGLSLISACSQVADDGATSSAHPAELTQSADIGTFESYWPTMSAASLAKQLQPVVELVTDARISIADIQASMKFNSARVALKLGDARVLVHVPRNEFRVLNSKLSEDVTRTERSIDEKKARELFEAAFKRLTESGILEAADYDLTRARQSTKKSGIALGGEEAISEIHEYRYLANRVINGVDFVNAGLTIAIHHTGRVSEVRIGGAAVRSIKSLTGELPTGPGFLATANYDERLLVDRFSKEYPRAHVDWARPLYMLPNGNLDAGIVEERYVFSFSQLFDRAASRRMYVGYSLTDPNAPPINLSETPNPNARGDIRK